MCVCVTSRVETIFRAVKRRTSTEREKESRDPEVWFTMINQWTDSL